MRRFLLAALVIAGLAACSEDEIKGGTKATKSGGVPGNIYEVEINGLPCVLWMDKHGASETSWAYSGIDCDWRER